MKKTEKENLPTLAVLTLFALFALFAFALFFSSNILVFAQKTKNINKFENSIILTIGSEKIPFGEVKKAYDKNAMKKGIPFESISRDSALSFLDLYIKYKIKVIDGRKNNFDKDSAVVEEIRKNRTLLAESFLLESSLIEPQIRRFMEMRKVEKKIAMIMTIFQPDGDTLDAYNSIQYALKEIQNGGTFENTAKKYSADSMTAVNGGVLPVYITGLKVQRSMEDPIYNLKIGEYTKQPIKTNFGYFLIKLIDEKPREFVLVSHILVPLKNDNAQLGPIVQDSAAAKNLIDSIHNLLSKGAKFPEIARQFSSDKVTSEKGGMLGIYSRSTGLSESNDILVTEVEEAVYSLKDRQFSKPVLSKYGYHIVRRDSTIVYPEDFEKDEIKTNYRRLYFQEDKARFYDSLARSLCNFSLNQDNFNMLLSRIDTTKTALDVNLIPSIPVDLMQKTLYSINNQNYTIEIFIKTITEQPEFKLTPTNRESLEKVTRRIIEPIIIETATKNIENTHPQFKLIMDEFTDGIILFKSESANVWDKLVFDTVFALQFYDTTTIDLKVPPQYNLSEIFVLSEEKAKEIYELLKSGKMTFEEAAAEFTQRAGAFRDRKGNYGFIAGNNYLIVKFLEAGLQVGEYTEPIKYDNGFAIATITEILPERKRTFEESLQFISGAVQSELQRKLEDDWLNQLKQTYKVVINNKLIDEIFGKKK